MTGAPNVKVGLCFALLAVATQLVPSCTATTKVGKEAWSVRVNATGMPSLYWIDEPSLTVGYVEGIGNPRLVVRDLHKNGTLLWREELPFLFSFFIQSGVLLSWATESNHFTAYDLRSGDVLWTKTHGLVPTTTPRAFSGLFWFATKESSGNHLLLGISPKDGNVTKTFDLTTLGITSMEIYSYRTGADDMMLFCGVGLNVSSGTVAYNMSSYGSPVQRPCGGTSVGDKLFVYDVDGSKVTVYAYNVLTGEGPELFHKETYPGSPLPLALWCGTPKGRPTKENILIQTPNGYGTQLDAYAANKTRVWKKTYSWQNQLSVGGGDNAYAMTVDGERQRTCMHAYEWTSFTKRLDSCVESVGQYEAFFVAQDWYVGALIPQTGSHENDTVLIVWELESVL